MTSTFSGDLQRAEALNGIRYNFGANRGQDFRRENL